MACGHSSILEIHLPARVWHTRHNSFAACALPDKFWFRILGNSRFSCAEGEASPSVKMANNGLIEDRPSVMVMWRSRGLKAFLVHVDRGGLYNRNKKGENHEKDDCSVYGVVLGLGGKCPVSIV